MKSIPICQRSCALNCQASWLGPFAAVLKWQAEGLSSPETVREATSAWQRDMDHLAKFFNEVLIVGDGPKVPASELYSRYQAWCSLNAETALKIQDFKATLQEKYDVTHTRIKGRSYWRGVRFQ